MRHNDFKAGLVSISFRGLSPREILTEMKKANLSCIEWGSDVHAVCHDQEKLNEIAELQKAFDIRCSSYGTYFRLGIHENEQLLPYIEASKVLGTSILRVWCGNTDGSRMSPEEKDRLLALCREAASMAKKHGVTLCTECHIGTFTERKEDALWLMESVDSPNFRTYWQPFQTKSIEENEQYARALAPYTVHLHVFQWKQEKRYPLASGIGEWRRYLACFDTSRTLLLEFMPHDTVSELQAEAAALARIIGEEA